MPAESTCESARLEISVAHDERRPIDVDVAKHVESCVRCTSFATAIIGLDRALAAGKFDGAPDVSARVPVLVGRDRSPWWAVAAVAAVGLTVGLVIGTLGSRVDIGLAHELDDLLYASGSALDGLSADLVVVERGLHDEVPERVYAGSIDYVAPERLIIGLVDTTDYPSASWIHNDVRLAIADGSTITTAGAACPVSALPECLTDASTTAVTNLAPFVDGTLRPLELIGPGRSLGLASGINILGTSDLAGRSTIQIQSTVAGAELLRAITDRGSWRELHPTDPVVMWLDSETLVPLRIETFAADSPERALWQIRRGYSDMLGGLDPIFIVSLENLDTRPGIVELDVVDDARVGGFVDGDANVPEPDLPDGFERHRSGHWILPNGGRVDVASWSDGRTWLKVEVTSDWHDPRLFGVASPFVEQVDVSGRGVGYLTPSGDSLALHGSDADILVSGSVPRDVLIEVSASLGVAGLRVPDDWAEASIVTLDQFPDTVLVPEFEGWSALGRFGATEATILLTGGGERNVVIIQTEGSRFDLPVGPDVIAVDVMGVVGNYDSSTGTLVWVRDGLRLEAKSESVSMKELLEIAESMNVP